MRIGWLRLLEKRNIGQETPDSVPLLTRYFLFRVPWFGVYVHHLLRSDYDRSLHDHPFSFISIILKGGYLEHHDQTKDGNEVAELRKVGDILLRPAEWRHRLELFPGGAWTLIIVGPRVRPWGFHLPSGWCWWRKHNSQLNICEEEVIWTEGKD
jgi:hypothetical protein